MKQTYLRRVLSVVLALIMALSSVPTASLAEMAAVREAPEQAQNSDKAGQDVSGSLAPASVVSEADARRETTSGAAASGEKNASGTDGGEPREVGEPREADASATATPTAFVQEVSVEGTRVRVEAEPGTFPEGARLSARSVPLVQRAQAELAVDEARAGDQSVTAS